MKKLIGLLVGVSVLIPSLALANVDITLSGGNVTVQQGQVFQEPGYSAFSTFDGNITGQVAVAGSNTSQPGTFLVTYSVTDSNLDSAFASRGLTVNGNGGGMIYCSGPLAPGWNTSMPDGGCGGSSRYVPFGQPMGSKFGSTAVCDIIFGCMVKN